jgi:hypothetical protein
MKQRASALAIGLACCLVPCAARAEAPSPSEADRAEAAERFDRGLRLFNGGDSGGALAEFRRAYELIPNVLVLYNLGLVYAQMGRAVDAADALERVLASPGGLSPERLAIARRTHDEQAARIAEISVTTSVEGASVEVDGVERGKTPLNAPLRVPSGTHVVGVIAPGFVPQRKEVTIASGEKQSLTLDLVAMQGRLAHVAVKTHLPGADVFADDQRVGTTPLAASIPLAPGNHRLEMRRPGYATAVAGVVLGDGAAGEVTLEPEEDAAALASAGGRLVLDIDETQAVVSVDGRSRGVYAEPLRLAAGPHRVLIERGNFEPFGRDVIVLAGASVNVRVELEPTPEYRARFVAHAHAQRTWGLVSIIGGAVVGAAGAGLAVYDAKQRSDGNATLASLQAQSTLHSGEICDSATQATIYQVVCLDPMSAASAKVSDANVRDYFAWSGVGVGAAAVVLGVTLLLTSDDPHAYDRHPPTAPRDAYRITPSFWSAPGGGIAGASGTF